MPGDTITRSYLVTNTLDKPYQLSICSRNAYSMPLDFKQLIQVKITWDGAVIYHGDLIGERDADGNILLDGIDLGEISPSVKKYLTAEFHFPGPAMTNEYMNATARVNWVLDAIILEEPSKPDEVSKVPLTADNKTIFLVASMFLLRLFFLIWARQKKKKNIE